jgi:cytochrome P450
MLTLIREPLDGPVRLAREHGDILRVPLPWPLPDTLLVSHPDDVEQVLTRDFRSYRKDWFTRQLEYILGRGLVTAEGASWKRHRKLMNPAFHHKRIAGYAEVMVECTAAMSAAWRDQDELDVHEQMMSLTLDIVARTLFGGDVGDEAKQVHHMLDDLMVHFMGIGGSGVRIPMAVPTPGNRKARGILDALDHLVQDLIARRRENPGDDLLSWLIAASDDEGGGMSDTQLRDEAITLLMAGHETTALALTFTFYLLAKNPEAEAALVAELDRVLGDGLPTMADLKLLTYTEAVVQESMRLLPPVWAIGREALEPTTLGEYDVVKGDQLFISMWAMHRDPRFYDEPDAFRPERWLSGRKRPHFAYLPFGGGPRICIGKRFAMMESVLLLATLMREHKLELVNEDLGELLPSVTLRPRDGLPVRRMARKRSLRASA